MTLIKCDECLGDGWDEDFLKCAECGGWGLVDDGEPNDDYDDGDYEPAWPTISDRHQFGY